MRANDILDERNDQSEMTKVTLRYDLSRPLTDPDFEQIAAAHSTYGMVRVQVAGNQIIVDYDASRLMAKDVEAALLRHGLPIRTMTA